MAGVTDNYGLATDVAVDDFVQPGHNNRVADTVDRVLGSVLRRLLTAGVYEGWSIQADKTVGPGQGLVAACWCETAAAKGISGLTDGAVNHVFLEATPDSPTEGEISVFAQLSSSGPTDAIYLGTIELDGSGAVVAIANDAEGVGRQCYPLAWRSLSGEGTEAGVPAGEQVSFAISHEPLRVPGAISLQSGSPDFTWEIGETWRSDSFTLTVTNNGGSEADFEYTWAREGIAE
ncbi:MAG: hypothetical protein ACP5KN_11685 [Armatimonadota bacterium]